MLVQPQPYEVDARIRRQQVFHGRLEDLDVRRMRRVRQHRSRDARFRRHDRGQFGRVNAELESHRHLDAACVGHVQHPAHQCLGFAVAILVRARRGGALGAERVTAGEQLAGAEGEILDGQRAVTPAGRQRRIEAGLRQHVAVLQPDHRLDVGGIPLGTTRVAVEPDEVQPLSLQVVEVGAIVRLVPRGRPGEEVVPRQRPADGERES